MSSEAALQLPKLLNAADELVIRSPRLEWSDEQIFEALSNGDKPALATLFQRYGGAVLNVSRRILRDEAEAQDLRQEVFLYLFERAKLYDAQKGSAASWIIQITYHRAIDRRRFLNFRQHYKVEAWEEHRVTASASELSTDDLDGKAIFERLNGQLSPEQRQTLELHFFEGYTLREIAEQSGQTIGNVRHHYYRALERLRSSLFSKKTSLK